MQLFLVPNLHLQKVNKKRFLKNLRVYVDNHYNICICLLFVNNAG
jgi:hypothetical protein